MTEDSKKAQLGLAIRRVRKWRKRTQHQLHKKTGFSINYLSLVENGKKEMTIGSLRKTAEALRVPVAVLFALAQSPDDLSDPEMVELLDLLRDLTLRYVKEDAGDAVAAR